VAKSSWRKRLDLGTQAKSRLCSAFQAIFKDGWWDRDADAEGSTGHLLLAGIRRGTAMISPLSTTSTKLIADAGTEHGS